MLGKFPPLADVLRHRAMKNLEYTRRIEPAGSLTLYMGPMFAGKATTLLHLADALQQVGQPFLTVKPLADVRYQRGPPELVSHDGGRLVACTVGDPNELLGRMDSVYHDARYIVIDEARMFVPDGLVNFYLTAVDTDLKHLFLACVDGGTAREPISLGISRLIPKADHVYRLHASWQSPEGCSHPALFTIRTKPVIDDNWIGGAEQRWAQTFFSGTGTERKPVPVLFHTRSRSRYYRS